MTILVLGSSGATGKTLTRHLLNRGQQVSVITRSIEALPDDIKNHPNLSAVQANILDLSQNELIEYIKDCRAVASCLGHTISIRGIFGPPFKLVSETIRRVHEAIIAINPNTPIKIALMNTTAHRNRDLEERHTSGEKFVLSLLRLLLPPQRDNEMAAEYLRATIGQNDPKVEWVAVRPDTLIDASEVTEYMTYESPIRSAVFDPGKTSRINVGHFMAELITNPDVWSTWKGRMPVLYNKE